jgi:hypothetical protein
MSKLPNDCIVYFIYKSAGEGEGWFETNQNQTNTTGAQNLKEFNNTAGWLSVFFGVFFCNELIK